MRKVIVYLIVKLEIDANEGVDISEVIDDLDYNFTTGERDDCGIADTEILEYEIKDSK
jgi:hypothetical protein